MEQALGVAVSIIGPLMLVLGGIAQIKLNKKMGRCGQPLIMIVLALAFHGTNVAYGFAAGKWPVVIPSAVGVVLWMYIARQYGNPQTCAGPIHEYDGED